MTGLNSKKLNATPGSQEPLVFVTQLDAHSLTKTAVEDFLRRASVFHADVASFASRGGLARARDVARPLTVAGLDRELASLAAILEGLLTDPQWVGSGGRVDRRRYPKRKNEPLFEVGPET